MKHNINPNRPIPPPSLLELKALRLLATKKSTDNLGSQIWELINSSQSPIFVQSLQELSHRFTLTELQNMIAKIREESKPTNNEYNHDSTFTHQISKIRSPKLLTQNIRQTKVGIMDAFRNLKKTQEVTNQATDLKNSNQLYEPKFKPKPQYKSELKAGEFEL
jgi:hypothetical protein